MPSLQLLQLTEHGRGFLASRRKALLVASGIIVAGGTAAAFMQSRNSYRKTDLSSCKGSKGKEGKEKLIGKDNNNVDKSRQKKGGMRSLQILAALLSSRMGRVGTGDLLALVAIAVLRTTISNRLAKVQGFLFRAAFLRRVPAFFRLILENILLCFLQSALHSTSKYVTGTLSLRFRKILTSLVHDQYFQNMVYYKLSHVDRRISNPEQRIASDVPRFCSELSDLVQEDLVAVTDGLLYTWRLCSYASPKYILWILAYVLGAGGMIRKFSPAFGKLMSKEQQLEGEYRQLHSRIRTHAESIAFYGGETREDSHIQQKFKSLVRHMRAVHHDNWWFGMIQDFLLKYLGATVAVILIIEPFFSGDLRPDSSTIGRAEMLSNLRYHTSVIISLFQSLGTLSISSRRLNRLSGYAGRIHELMVTSRELGARDDSSQQINGNRNYVSEANYIEFDSVKVVTPTGNVLVEDLTLRVESGSNLLITGAMISLFHLLNTLSIFFYYHLAKHVNLFLYIFIL
ncbi:ATP-binding cassette [Lithospermum erythrorhizon]|uniref:ATP-binding cassette n=1 Tax=Lithospermum erythrorhizon TaxID=34254 RepID=A0AAV3S1I0_LITER